MSKLTLTDIAAGYGAPATLNANNGRIEAALENTLSRDGTAPNNMETELDMDSNRIINLGSPADSNDAARWIDVTDAVNLTGTAVPALTGNSQKYLGTDGSTLGWKNFYNQSSAELSASVTPTYFTKDYIDVTRYGAVGDGSTSNTTAVQNALNAAAVGKARIHFPSQNLNGQTIYICGKVQVYEGTTISADPGVVIRSSITVANDHVFECIGVLGSGVALSANTAKRDTSVTVASTTGLAAGGLVCIRDTQYKWSTNGRNLEFNEIDSISGAGPYTVTLKNRLLGAYLTASSAEIVPMTTSARDITFENVYVDVPSGKDGGAFYFQDAYRCKVVNCRSTGQKGQPGVQIWRCGFVNVYGGDFSDGQSQSSTGYGYGCNIAQSSHHCVVRGAVFRNVRECAIALGSRHCGYVDCVSWSSYDNSFNTHADGCEDCYFDNCHSYYARSKGFVSGGAAGQAPDKRIRYINCEAHYTGYLGFWADGSVGVESQDISFEGCKAFHYGDDTGTSYGFYAFRSTRPRILNCSANADGEVNARALVKVEICTDAHVKRGNFRSATSGWGIIHANCTGVMIEGNDIADIGGSQGVYAESTPSTGVYVRNNKVDNNVAFTMNAGDIHEFNLYSTKSDTTWGSSTVADGGTITHSNIGSPAHVQVQGTVSGEFVSVTAVGATTATLAIKKHDNTAGTSQTIYWRTQR